MLNYFKNLFSWIIRYSYISTPNFLIFFILIIFILYFDNQAYHLLYLTLIGVIFLILRLFQLRFSFLIILLISFLYILFLFLGSNFYLSSLHIVKQDNVFIDGCGIIQNVNKNKSQIEVINLVVENRPLTRSLVLKAVPDYILNSLIELNLVCIKGTFKIETIGLKLYAFYNNKIKIYQQYLFFADKILYIKEKINKVAYLYFGYPNSSIVKSILFGIKDDEFNNSDIKELFQNLGLAHVLVASGANILIILSVFNFIFRGLVIKHLNISSYFNFFLHMFYLIIVFIYLMVVGIEGSLVRAILFFLVHIYSHLQGREYSNYSILSFSIIFIAYFLPSLFFSLNLIFSVAAVMGLFLAMKVKKILNFYVRQVLNNYWVDSLVNSVCVIFLTSLISLHFFKTINLNGFISNIILLPFIEILIYSSFVIFLLEFFTFLFPIPISYYLNFLIAEFVNILIGYILDFMKLWDSIFGEFLIFSRLQFPDNIYFNVAYIAIVSILFLFFDYLLYLKLTKLK